MVDNNELKPWFVYQYTFPNNKVYIGKSNIYNKRFMHPQTYRTQTVYRAMCKYPGYRGVILKFFTTEDEAFKYEESKIKELNANDPLYGYNNTEGGDGVKSEIIRKPVERYSLSGEFLDEWPSIHEAGLVLNISESSITCACSEKYGSRTAGKFQWKYKTDNKKISNIENKYFYNIYQYTKDGVFVQKWEDIPSIVKQLGYKASSLYRVINGERKTYKNFHWTTNFLGERMNPIVYDNYRKINQYDISGKFIKTWDSIKDIVKEFNIDSSSISHVCGGSRLLSAGYQWRYDDNIIPVHDLIKENYTFRKSNKNASKRR